MPEPREYTVGWITALPHERIAAYTCLDNVHPDLAIGYARDNNIYTIGDIAGHKVVIASLPLGQYGLSSATRVGQDMLRTFPNIRLGLMVGIGAGAPSNKHDIRLGDVVVSAPGNTGHGGVLQYDFGKLHHDGSLDLNKHLNQPPQIFTSALGALQMDYQIFDRRIDLKVQGMLEKYDTLSADYQRPEPRSDRLYRSDYPHSEPHLECDECCGDDAGNLHERATRSDRFKVKVHHGLIASSNQLLKNAQVRDKWASKADVLCFEMEAAGLMNDFPCVVVRGICDYADSHKNDKWQCYAAMTAAAYAKELLEKIPITAAEGQARIVDVHNKVQRLLDSKRIEWLSVPDYRSNLQQAQDKRLSKTGNWFITSKEYQDWRIQQTSLLSLRGTTGCGKTVLSSVAIEDLLRDKKNVVFFFFDSRRPVNLSAFHSKFDASNQSYSKDDKISACSMIRSLIYQLLEIAGTDDDRDDLYSNFSDGTRKPFADGVLMPFFDQLAKRTKDLWMVLDAIDECLDPSAVLQWIQNLSKSPNLNLHVIITNRNNYDINKRIGEWQTAKHIVEVTKDKTQPDIDLFIQKSLDEIEKLKTWDDEDAVQNIQNDLKKKSAGMFMLVVCQLNMLKACDSTMEAGICLESFPSELSEVYNHILNDIKPHKRTQAIRLLQLMTYSERTLRLDEVSEAIAMDPEHEVTERQPGIKPYSIILSYCPSFLQVTNSWRDLDGTDEGAKEIEFAHPSMKEHLVSVDLEKKLQSEFEEQAVNHSLTQICINYLFILDESLSFEEIKKTYPFALYAAGNWLHHAASCIQRKDGLRHRIVDLLMSTRFTYCLQICDPEVRYRDEYSPSYSLYKAGEALYYTCRMGLQSEVISLLRRNSDPNSEGGKYGTPLQAACYGGHMGVVRLLIDATANINPVSKSPRNPRDRNGIGHYGSPLQAACRKGHLEIAQFLLKNNANVNFQGGRYGSALQATVPSQNIELLEILLDAGASINEVGGKYGTAIQAAASDNYLKVVQILLSKGANPNLKGGAYGTPLYAATFHGHENIVEELIMGKAEIDIEGNHQLHTCLLPNGHNKMIIGVFSDSHEHVYRDAIPGWFNRIDIAKIRAPLYGASVAGHDRLVERFLKADAKPDTRCGGFGSSLIAASSQGLEKTVKILLKNGAQVDFVAGHWGTALQVAAFQGNDKMINLLLEKKAAINLISGQYQTALQAACAEGKTETVRLLLRKGANINICGKYGSPLQVACVREREEIVSLLLENGAEVDDQCGWYGNALQAASVAGNSAIVQKLLDVKPKPNVNAQSGVYGTALFAAACGGHFEVSQLLLNHGADVNGRGGCFGSFIGDMNIFHSALLRMADNFVLEEIREEHEQTRFCPKVRRFGSILSGASGGGHVDIVEMLLKKGAIINERGGVYGSALHEAVCKQKPDIVDLLLQSNADIEIQDAVGATPLFKATENQDLPIVQLLLNHGADPNTRGPSGETPLHISVLGRDEKILELLLSKDADVSCEGAALGTALFRSALIGNLAMVRCLLDVKGIDVDDGGPIGTPLAAASFAGHKEIIELLKGSGATTGDGGSWNRALTLVASLGYTSMAQVLIEGGADVDSQDEDAISAICLARRYGRKAIINLLEGNNADGTLTGAVLDEAIEFYTELLANADKKDDYRIVKIMTNLAYLLVASDNDREDEAIDLLQRVYDSRSKEFGEIAPETAYALTDLGIAMAAGRYIDRATEALYKATQGYQRAYGVTEEIKEAFWCLALVLAWQGEIDAAFEVLLEANVQTNRYIELDPRAAKAKMEEGIKQYFQGHADANLLV